MRGLVLIIALGALSACGGGSEKRDAATFACPNGPSLVVGYTETDARIVFPDGRVEVLPKVEGDDPNLWAKPGVVWDLTQFRTARLTDGQRSYNCDQMAG